LHSKRGLHITHTFFHAIEASNMGGEVVIMRIEAIVYQYELVNDLV